MIIQKCSNSKLFVLFVFLSLSLLGTAEDYSIVFLKSAELRQISLAEQNKLILLKASNNSKRVTHFAVSASGDFIFLEQNLDTITKQPSYTLRQFSEAGLSTETVEMSVDPILIRYLDLSPDGQQLAFSGGTDFCTSSLYVQDVKSGKINRLTYGEEVVEAISWSPDGSKIAFYYGKDKNVLTNGGFSLRIIDKDGQNLTEIAGPSKITRFDHKRDIPPIWSPDGTALYFEANYEKEDVAYYNTYVMKLNETLPKRLTAGLCTSISLDGETLYCFDRGLYELNVKSMNKTALGFNTPGKSGCFPKLSPDGHSLAFVTWDGIFVMDLKGDKTVEKVSDLIPSPEVSQFEWVIGLPQNVN
jgi:Tol biopolymer transport system component